MKTAIVVPAYKCKRHILDVLARVGPEVHRIYVVDDGCPEKTGEFVRECSRDPRVTVIGSEGNGGVGAAMMLGYQKALEDNIEIILKIDGDGQMDPTLIPRFVAPIISGRADYTKGNRFYDIRSLEQMPKIRVIGNAVLSFFSKISSGYWDIFDPTNGYTAIHARVLELLPFSKISRRYFFESDMLFRLNVLRARVLDIPMDSQYGDEKSGLKISKITFEFLYKHCRNTLKRIFYNYFLRGFSLASILLILGIGLSLFGVGFGSYAWIRGAFTGLYTPAGTVMLAGLPIILGGQMLLNFIGYDIESVPKESLHVFLEDENYESSRSLPNSRPFEDRIIHRDS